MPVHNADIAAIFDEIADLLEIRAANPFRIRADRNAARSVGGYGREFKTLIDSGAVGWNATTCSTAATSRRCVRGAVSVVKYSVSLPENGGGASLRHRPMPSNRFLIPDKIITPPGGYHEHGQTRCAIGKAQWCRFLPAPL